MARLLATARAHPYWTLFGLSLVFRLITALFYLQPGYTDAYYYTNVATQLWRGHGFRDDYLWNFLSHPLPDSVTGNPSNTYWMPFTSVLVASGFFLTFGNSFFAAQLPIVLMSSTFAPLAYYIGLSQFGPEQGRRYGWLMGWLTIFCVFYAPFFALPDNFTPFALFSMLFLIFTGKVLKGEPTHNKWLALAGACAGLAYLTRVDGVMLLVVPPLCRVLLRNRRPSWSGMGLMLAAFVVVLLPWVGRNLVETGQPFPGGGTKTLFLREYDDFYSYNKPLDLAYYLNQTMPSATWGIGPLIQSKLDALYQNLLAFGRASIVFMTPLVFLGLFTRHIPGDPLPEFTWGKPGALWRSERFLPFVVYSVVLYLAMSLLFTFPSTHGSVFHSSAGLLPYIFAALIAGMDGLIGLLSRISRPKAALSRRRAYSTILVLVFTVATAGWIMAHSSGWDAQYNRLKLAVAWLDQNAPAGITVMTPEPGQYWYLTNRPAIGITSDPLEVNLELARRYQASYLIFQPANLTNSFIPLWENKGYPGFTRVATFGETEIYKIDLLEGK